MKDYPRYYRKPILIFGKDRWKFARADDPHGYIMWIEEKEGIFVDVEKSCTFTEKYLNSIEGIRTGWKMFYPDLRTHSIRGLLRRWLAT
jgi:hypothetical protein